MSEGPDDALDILWQRVLEDWHEPKPHTALLEYALAMQRLPDVAGRYRALEDDPDKGAEAKKRLQGVVLAATQLLMSTATTREKTRGPAIVLVVAIVVFFALMTWAARAILSMSH